MEATLDPSTRILQAARRLFFARGFAKTQLRAIAAEAGTSESGVLRFYDSKTTLLRAVCESCWAEVNARLEAALQAAAERDADPRSLLLEVMRTVLSLAKTNAPMMTFLQTHFASPEAIGAVPGEGGTAGGVPSAGAEFHRYLDRIEGLCKAAIEARPAFTIAGVTASALTHVVQSAIYGMQAGWYIADQEQAPESDKVSIDEGVAVLRCLLYQNAAS
jgi:AcrR family transcriptional regulator